MEATEAAAEMWYLWWERENIRSMISVTINICVQAGVSMVREATGKDAVPKT